MFELKKKQIFYKYYTGIKTKQISFVSLQFTDVWIKKKTDILQILYRNETSNVNGQTKFLGYRRFH